MGASSSKKRNSNSNWSWTGPPGDHSPFPVDRIPYQGPELLYCFVDIMTSFKIIKNDINLGPPAVTTNVEQYLDQIQDCYGQGLLLNKFVRVPSVKMTTQVTDWTSTEPYQAILSKPTTKMSHLQEDDQSWQLKVEKRILSTRTLAFDKTSKENNLLLTIEKYASEGARLVCAEPVGCVRSDSRNSQYGIMGVDLFFNVPKHSPVQYTYHTVTIPAMYHIFPDPTQTIQQVVCDADFLGQLKIFLNSGWKLVDICFDSTSIADAYKLRAASQRFETIWIFEKETEKLIDDRPVYEGVIVEYLHKVKVSSDREIPCRDWRPVIAGMGMSGWELASIIQTPLLIQSGFTTYTMKLLFIFQRPIFQFPFHSKSHIKSTSARHGGGGSGRNRSLGGDRDPGMGNGGGGGGGGGLAPRSSASLGNQRHDDSEYYGNNTMSTGLVTNGYVSVALSDSNKNVNFERLPNPAEEDYAQKRKRSSSLNLVNGGERHVGFVDDVTIADDRSLRTGLTEPPLAFSKSSAWLRSLPNSAEMDAYQRYNGAGFRSYDFDDDGTDCATNTQSTIESSTVTSSSTTEEGTFRPAGPLGNVFRPLVTPTT